MSEENKKYLNECHKNLAKWCVAYKKQEHNLGINETNRVENVNKHLKRLLKSSRLSISELVLRFMQFEELYNSSENLFLIEKKKYMELKHEMEKIPLIKHFAEVYSNYATIKFTINYYQSQLFKFDQKTKNAKNFEVFSKEKLNENTF